MKPEILDNIYLRRAALLGFFGTKVIAEGQTSHPDHEFLIVTATAKSVINYEAVDIEFPTYADDVVEGLTLEAGMSVNLGVIKNIEVQSGNVIGNLINRPKQ